MNYRFVVKQVGLLFLFLGCVLAAIAGFEAAQVWVGHISSHAAVLAFTLAGSGGALLGGLMWALARSETENLARREALLLVGITWLGGALLAGAPYHLWARFAGDAGQAHPFLSPVDCYFEAMSGLTTTGATVLTDIEALPRSILLWRSLTHWFGGLGIVVLFVAVFPNLGVGGKRLFRFEAPGPPTAGVTPRIRETARILWLIYAGLTMVETVALRVAGLSWFDALCHTMATLATGGFSTLNASVGGYHSLGVELIVVVFMVVAGANFTLYLHALSGRWRHLFRDTEMRAYLATLLLGFLIITITLIEHPVVRTTGHRQEPHPATAAREALFTTVAIQTTTGFCTSDSNQWPFLAKGTLVILMLIGGCSGSTGGGIKVIRVWVSLRVMASEIERAFRPNVVRPKTIGGVPVDTEMRLSILAFTLGMLVIFVLGSAGIMILEPAGAVDYVTAATASIATLCTIGPGLGAVGAVANYAWFTAPSKLLLSFLMVVGRLEIFAVLVLFSPRFWRAD